MKLLFRVLLLVGLIGCGHHKHSSEAVILGDGLEVKNYGPVFISEQPKNTDLKMLKEKGFKAIINLRVPSEYDEASERKAAVKNGLAYYNIPFYMDKDLTDSYIEEVTAKVLLHKDEGKVLVHCSSGNRAAIWIGGHFFHDHKFSSEKSLQLAKSLGLTKEKAEAKLNKYLISK